MGQAQVIGINEQAQHAQRWESLIHALTVLDLELKRIGVAPIAWPNAPSGEKNERAYLETVKARLQVAMEKLTAAMSTPKGQTPDLPGWPKALDPQEWGRMMGNAAVAVARKASEIAHHTAKDLAGGFKRAGDFVERSIATFGVVGVLLLLLGLYLVFGRRG